MRKRADDVLEEKDNWIVLAVVLRKKIMLVCCRSQRGPEDVAVIGLQPSFWVVARWRRRQKGMNLWLDDLWRLKGTHLWSGYPLSRLNAPRPWSLHPAACR